MHLNRIVWDLDSIVINFQIWTWIQIYIRSWIRVELEFRKVDSGHL